MKKIKCKGWQKKCKNIAIYSLYRKHYCKKCFQTQINQLRWIVLFDGYVDEEYFKKKYRRKG